LLDNEEPYALRSGVIFNVQGTNTAVTFHDWAALILGAILIANGVSAIRRCKTGVPGWNEGKSAVRLGWLWLMLGTLFIFAVLFDISFLKTFFRIFLEAPN
jgi:hypothetical protein